MVVSRMELKYSLVVYPKLSFDIMTSGQEISLVSVTLVGHELELKRLFGAQM